MRTEREHRIITGQMVIKLYSDCFFNKFGDILKIRDWTEVGKDLRVSRYKLSNSFYVDINAY